MVHIIRPGSTASICEMVHIIKPQVQIKLSRLNLGLKETYLSN